MRGQEEMRDVPSPAEIGAIDASILHNRFDRFYTSVERVKSRSTRIHATDEDIGVQTLYSIVRAVDTPILQHESTSHS